VSAELEVGEDVIAIGHAFGLPGGPTVSKDVVSALDRFIDMDSSIPIVDLIQTDSEINPGNSGGALANSRAEVIGINTAIIESGQGIGFAINIDDAKIVLSQLMNKGYVAHGYVGIPPMNVTPGLASRFNLPVTEGSARPNHCRHRSGRRRAAGGGHYREAGGHSHPKHRRASQVRHHPSSRGDHSGCLFPRRQRNSDRTNPRRPPLILNNKLRAWLSGLGRR
jgi:hypothetical protein